jgi:hypothetical protein
LFDPCSERGFIASYWQSFRFVGSIAFCGGSERDERDGEMVGAGLHPRPGLSQVSTENVQLDIDAELQPKGIFALCILIPKCHAYFCKSFTPFPGAARTAANLAARWPLASVIVLAGLAILAVHLVFYPWPD